ncbi:hypothetical protein [Bacillus sp. AFS053548]|uniref:hypothetical protein n=1 Tax=Bacillus sp. AFS053548 TaxID=2033505 RepID=UPI000BFD688A|nr:hypothetical protein [Bacillus sp. AFS053548]PGM56919.1 hypothetical protein CN946_08170 [Bacillus sp. AFS053548]
MKKVIVSCIFLVFLVVIGFGVYYYIPKTVNASIMGVEYQLGSGHDQVNSVTIKIKGKLHHSLLGKRRFLGSIDVKGAKYPNPNKNRKLEIAFDQNGMGTIVYGYFENGKPFTESYGILFANKDFKKVTIGEFREDHNGKGWTGKDGWMVTGPTNSKSEALIISNELMKKFLRNKLK